jgi:hypothetical protein
MQTAEAGTSTARRSRYPKLVRAIAFSSLVVLLVVWAAAAIYFGGYGGGPWRFAISALFVGLSAWTWLFARKTQPLLGFWCATFVAVLLWYITLRPSHHRDWKLEVAALPRVEIEGDQARLTGYRDFAYRSRNDFDVHYRERTISLSDIEGIDLFISYWGKELMAHTFLSFRFKNAEPVCVSIEGRMEKGETFAALPGIFKRFELIYVLGDERDIIRVRTNHRGEEVYMYPIKVTPEAARRLFLVYAAKINRLAQEPEFYHLLSNSCTANIVRNAEAAGHRTSIFEGRFVLNGLVDRYLYDAGLVENAIPFPNLRRRARITDIAKISPDEGFSNHIRSDR